MGLVAFLPSADFKSRRQAGTGIIGVISARDRGKKSGGVVGSTEKEGAVCGRRGLPHGKEPLAGAAS